jgi:transcriptional regulator with XRE-family HTH domain
MSRSDVELSEYERLRPRYDLVSKIRNARKELNITQEELALRIGTKKSNISRLESGNYNPTINFISKVAKGLGKEIHIELK